MMLQKRKGMVRSIDVANELGFSKPSVSIAMKNLRENGYIEVDADGCLILLDAGRQIAEKMYERHTLLSNWLVALGVDPDTAVKDACRIEHALKPLRRTHNATASVTNPGPGIFQTGGFSCKRKGRRSGACRERPIGPFSFEHVRLFLRPIILPSPITA